MSVTFTCPEAPKSTLPCPWCGEGGEWIDKPHMLTDDGRCDPWCKGSVQESTAPEVNFSNHNAEGVLRLLGLQNPEGPWGSLTADEIPAVLQRCLIAINSDSQRASLVEAPFEGGGERRVTLNGDGVPQITTGCRIIYGGNTDADTVRRVTHVQTLLVWAHDCGLGVSWG